ncbi:redox-sensing transcriptional repressor Rex [Spirochaeta lutea]|uniref:Redox-sensing transcriptional repressor Rex n=1 Tax=Spirochaeta lutea TaxID=1480694 RepID=A0A098R0X1_9SPIO|nr:redox-sensing transcriptional repressor Rex [Spirochaeta lutea]KGE73649.1 REX family transcriptional regulator [Spirochaeta lutea]
MAGVKLSSLPTIKRLPSYLHIIEAAQREGKEYISGTVIADELELEPIQVRKDLAITGIVGKPRIGFPVGELIDAITHFLDWHHNHRAVLIGAGNLGTALMGYSEFTRHGLTILAAFDVDTAKFDKSINDITVHPFDDIPKMIPELGVELAILTVPSDFAQQTAEILIQSGIKAIWNFTNVKLKVPSGIIVQKEDLSSGYAVLSVKMARSRS